MRAMIRHLEPKNGRAWDNGEEVLVPVHYPHQIRRDGPGKVLTKAITKDYRLVYDKRVIQPDLTTLPYGFLFSTRERSLTSYCITFIRTHAQTLFSIVDSMVQVLQS